jgi:hypothetical protein
MSGSFQDSFTGSFVLKHKIDLVERFGLKEVKIEKPTWGTYIKMYLKRVKTKLEEDGEFDRIIRALSNL